MKYKELIKNAVLDSLSFLDRHPSDLIPSATEFFQAIRDFDIDKDFWENASTRFTHHDQTVNYLEAFGRLYVMTEDDEEYRFPSLYALEQCLEGWAIEADRVYRDRLKLQSDIDAYLLRS